MSQQAKISLIGSILLGSLLLGIYLTASRRAAKSKRAVVGHKVNTPAEEVQKYWTPEKMRDAQPAKMPEVFTREHEKQDRS
jgi:hypothetical protein